MMPLMSNINPAVPNANALCSLNHTSCGTAEINPTRTAPAPSETITAGNTQQTSVAELASSAAAEAPTVRSKVIFILLP
jgi:hypothetical protein